MRTADIIFFIRNYILRNSKILETLIENITACQFVAKVTQIAHHVTSAGQTGIVVSVRKNSKKEVMAALSGIVEKTVISFHSDIQGIINSTFESTFERVHVLSNYMECIWLATDVVEVSPTTFVIRI